MWFNQSVNNFRARRGRILLEQIRNLARVLGRDVVILDLGGRADYWSNVGFDNIARIDLVNTSEAEFGSEYPVGSPQHLFSHSIGDAKNLSEFADQSVDLVHSNSVIEHVGRWQDMKAMAREAMRVGRSGWIQTPAWEFPVEPHFHLPFVHWFGAPIRARLLSVSPLTAFRRCDLDERRALVEEMNLVSRREFRALFPGTDIFVERLLFAKSYTARWMPSDETSKHQST